MYTEPNNKCIMLFFSHLMATVSNVQTDFTSWCRARYMYHANGTFVSARGSRVLGKEQNTLHYLINIRNFECKDNAIYAKNKYWKQGLRKKAYSIFMVYRIESSHVYYIFIPQYTDNDKKIHNNNLNIITFFKLLHALLLWQRRRLIYRFLVLLTSQLEYINITVWPTLTSYSDIRSKYRKPQQLLFI